MDALLRLARDPALRSASLLSVLLLLYGNLTSLFEPDRREDFLLYSNLGLLSLLLLWGQWTGFSLSDLGLAAAQLRASALWGVVLGLVLALPPVAFIALAPLVTGEPVRAGEINDLSGSGMAIRLALRVPVATALFEEVAFRGILYAVWLRATDLRRTVLGTGVVFALWHTVITFKSVSEAEVVESAPLVALAYLGSLAGLFVGGVAFALLRWRTGGVAGPFFFHWIVVALMTLAVWLRS
jgi:membrane protease YdiL (CAAX protease family)